jgi:hypothetical protein
MTAEADQLNLDFAAALTAGVAVDSDRAAALAERHLDGIRRAYDCGYEMQVNLAEMYLADERFTRYYDRVAAGLAQYVHDAIVANAARHA